MDKHAKMYQVLKTGKERLPPQRRAVLANQWDVVESEPETLAKERVFQQQLRLHIDHQDISKSKLPPKENADSLEDGDGKEEDTNEDDYHQLYDSLEVAAVAYVKKNSSLILFEGLEAQLAKREGAR